MTPRQIEEETRALFSPHYDHSDEEKLQFCYAQEDRAKRLIEEVGWHELFPYWNNYLRTECPTEDDVENFCHWFLSYGGEERPIPDPVGFCGYIHYRLDACAYDCKYQNMLDALSIEILRRAGLIVGWSDPYYAPDQDPRIVAEVKRLRDAEQDCFGDAFK